MFSTRKLRRKVIAVYPDGTRHEIVRDKYSRDMWQYHPRGSCASPLSVAKAEARSEGAKIETVMA